MSTRASGDVIARTKAETLAFIRSRGLTNGSVLPLFFVTNKEWTESSEEKLTLIETWYNTECNPTLYPIVPGVVLIRSSTLGEDNNERSNAGKFLTLQNVVIGRESLREGINQVFASYEDNLVDLDQVLIQPQLKDIQSSGVLLTRDLSSFSPYDTVSFDDKSTDSADVVTSGSGNVRTWYRFKEAKEVIHQKQFVPLLSMARELEQVFGHDHVDIEFAICKHPIKDESILFLLQARTLLDKGVGSASALTMDHIEAMISKFRMASKKFPGDKLLGDFTLFSTMTDWNPAEIIGVEPRTLARTLYQNIITDRIWAQQRKDFGYRDVVGFPLITNFNGVPYVDVRIDFNSWIPKGIPTGLAEKLVNFYLTKLKENPEMHDKVEFNIVFTCYFPGIRTKLISDLQTNNTTRFKFSDDEIRTIESALFALTSRILEPSDSEISVLMSGAAPRAAADFAPSAAVILDHYQKINELEERRKAILDSDLTDVQRIYWLIEELKIYGTLPFAGLARCGFIGVQYLRALESLGTISKQEFSDFMGSLETVTKKLSVHVESLNSGRVTRSDFLKIYGHLRPGTYDVLSRRYDEAFELYFNYSNNISNREAGKLPKKQRECDARSNLRPALPANSSDKEEMSISRSTSPILDNHSLHLSTQAVLQRSKQHPFPPETLKKIDAVFQDMELKPSTPFILKFMKEAIEGREYSKFIFTRCLSDVLSLIIKFGEDHGFSREKLSFLRIDTILDLYNNEHLVSPSAQTPTSQVYKALKSEIEKNEREYFQITQSVLLPPLLVDESEFFEFYQFKAAPNFITNKRAIANVVVCDSTTTQAKTNQLTPTSSRISGAIAFIRSADPGYDWLFTHNIAGLVTQYGGLNSHMSIRCAELGIPAVIGCGDKNFNAWKQAHCVDIDCGNKVVSIVT